MPELRKGLGAVLLAGSWRMLATAAALPLRLYLRARARRGKEIPARLGERRGLAPAPRPPGPLLWLHAASVGELTAALPVLDALHRRAPDLSLLVSTGTVTSARLLAERAPGLGLAGCLRHVFVPLDVPSWVRRFLTHWRPDAAVFLESELWPALLLETRARGIPLFLLNGRLSAQSFARWRNWRVARPLLDAFTAIYARSEEDAARFRALGAARVEVWGDLKFAAPPLPVEGTELARWQAALGTRPRWLAASTHPGEEEIAARLHARLAPHLPGLLTLIAPRHPERGAELGLQLGAPRRAAGAPPPQQGGLYLADTLGELGLFYRLTPLVFMGGSLVPHGGQNPLEAARLGAALLIGPHHHNFAEAVRALAAAGALEVTEDEEALASALARLLAAPEEVRRRGEKGEALLAAAGDLPERYAALLAAAVEGR